MLFAQTVNFELQSGRRGTHAACNKSIAQAGRLRNERQNLHLEMDDMQGFVVNIGN